MYIQVYCLAGEVISSFFNKISVFTFFTCFFNCLGASPIVYSVLFDDKTVGVSIMKILPKQLVSL